MDTHKRNSYERKGGKKRRENYKVKQKARSYVRRSFQLLRHRRHASAAALAACPFQPGGGAEELLAPGERRDHLERRRGLVHRNHVAGAEHPVFFGERERTRQRERGERERAER